MKRIILIFILVLMIPNYAFAETQDEIMSSTQEKFNISGFLKEAQKLADHIADVFGTSPGKIPGYPGHSIRDAS